MPFNMSVFTRKPWEYKCGVILLIIGTFLYIIAFSAPFWVIRESQESYGVHAGLWQACVYSRTYPTICYSVQIVFLSPPSPPLQNGVIAIRALQCIGLVGLILASWNEVQTNFFGGGFPCRYFTEVTGSLGSLAGFIGAMLLVYGLENVLPAFLRALGTYSWCLYVDILGTLSCALGTFLTFRFKRYGDTDCSVMTMSVSMLMSTKQFISSLSFPWDRLKAASDVLTSVHLVGSRDVTAQRLLLAAEMTENRS